MVNNILIKSFNFWKTILSFGLQNFVQRPPKFCPEASKILSAGHQKKIAHYVLHHFATFLAYFVGAFMCFFWNFYAFFWSNCIKNYAHLQKTQRALHFLKDASPMWSCHCEYAVTCIAESASPDGYGPSLLTNARGNSASDSQGLFLVHDP